MKGEQCKHIEPLPHDALEDHIRFIKIAYISPGWDTNKFIDETIAEFMKELVPVQRTGKDQELTFESFFMPNPISFWPWYDPNNLGA